MVSSTPWRRRTSSARAATALLQPGPDGVQRVRPHPVHELVLPVVAADGERRVVRTDQHRLDPGRPELDPQGGATVGDRRAGIRRSCQAARPDRRGRGRSHAAVRPSWLVSDMDPPRPGSCDRGVTARFPGDVSANIARSSPVSAPQRPRGPGARPHEQRARAPARDAGSPPASRASTSWTPRRPSSAKSWRTVVSGGVKYGASGRSSKPTTLTSSGISSPSSCRAASSPSAIWSLAGTPR